MLRVLLDTNIIIYRENKRMTNYSIGHLYRWLDKLKCDKLIHPYSVQEISKYSYQDPQESMTLKLDAYDIIKTVVPLDPVIAQSFAGNDKTENDRIDTALLNEVYVHRVDLLITEDKKLRNKANMVGLSGRVLSINAFISAATAQNPSLVEYKALAVKKVVFGDVDVNDIFFDSFRESYCAFNNWFARKCDEEAYICYTDAEKILGFLYLKTEIESENYSDITPAFPPRRRLKIGTFKVESTGFRLGERFIKIIIDNAIERGVDEIYVTLFENRQELDALSNLLKRWGFEYYGQKFSQGSTETVLVKQMRTFNHQLSAKQNFPNLRYDTQKFILPILPQYHTALMPDSILNNENEVNFLGKDACKYALQKVYISFSWERNINPGDFVIFYRNGEEGTQKKYTSVLTTVCIVDEIIYRFSSKSDFIHQCENRSVFTIEELNRFWDTHNGNLLILKFVLVKSFSKRPILGFLWDNGIVEAKTGPRPFTRITDQQFDSILAAAQTDLSKLWR